MIRTLVLMASLLLLAACSTSPVTRFYSLSNSAADPPLAGSAAPNTAVPAGGSAVALSIGPVSLPETIDRPQLVVREGTSRVVIREFDRWAEPLRTDISRVLATRIGAELGLSAVTSVQSAATEAPRRVALDFIRLDANAQGDVAADVVWIVRNRAGETIAQGRTAESVRGAADTDGLVRSHAQVIGAIAHAIARGLRQVP